MEANGEHFSGQGSTFPCAFLDPPHPEDQMAPFVFKESSYRISTFDIKIYTAYGVASYNGPFIPRLLSVYYLVSHRQKVCQHGQLQPCIATVSVRWPGKAPG